MNTVAADTSPPWFTPIREMLRLDDYALPLAAAQSQFRERFYGLNAAALLEDIYVDALENFTRRHCPQVSVQRAPRGEKSFDYTVAGTNISHKVGLGVTQIAVLWDATRHIPTWSAPHPIIYHLTDRAMRQREVWVSSGDSNPLSGYVRALHDVLPPERSTRAERRILVVYWPTGSQPARVLAVLAVPTGAKTLADVGSFSDLWGVVAKAETALGAPANEIDVLIFRTTKKGEVDALVADSTLQISEGLRSGLYGVESGWMDNLPLTRNNRAQLIPRNTVAELLSRAVRNECFVPLPTWIAPYAANRPPSLYLTQSQAFRQLFE